MRIRAFLIAVCVGGFVPAFGFAQTPNDTGYEDLWYLPHIQAPSAWDETTGSSEVIVAVLDTGVSLSHPDIQENIWENTQEVAENGKDDDGNGYIDDVHGWDFIGDDNIPEPVLEGASDEEAQSHGTFVAGMIGAIGDNEEGYTGVAWNVRIMPLRILDEQGAGNETDVAHAIAYAVDNGADVINLSFAGDQSHRTLRSAVEDAYEANVAIIAALGNDSRNVNNRPVYPACLRGSTADWVIGVTATNEDDRGTAFTNYGSDCADIAAPGVSIFGLGFTEDAESADDDELYIGPWDGTSMASPIVAGAAALMRSLYPNISVDDIRSALKISVDPAQVTEESGSLGAGRINVAAALEAAAAIVGDDGDHEEEDEASGSEQEDEGQTSDVPEGADDVLIALGARAGSEPRVEVWRADGTAYASFLAFDATFTGGVHVRVGDMNHDDVREIVATPGEGGGPQVRVFAPDGTLVNDFFAYDESSRQGVSVALGDVTGDEHEEIVTVVGADVSNDVVIFDREGNELSRFTVSGFVSGTRLTVAVGNVDTDAEQEIIVAAQNKEPRVAIYNADGTSLVAFLVYAENMDAGLNVSTGDFDSDARDEIVIGPLTGGAGHVRMVNYIGALWKEFFITEVTDGGGANVAVADIDHDGEKEIVTAAHGHTGSVQAWDASGILQTELLKDRIPAEGTWMGAW